VSEVLLEFSRPIAAPDGKLYEARACGSVLSANTWQGWIEFIPVRSGDPVRTARETTQPNRVDTEYWATGLTDVYLEGALKRALEPAAASVTLPPQPTVFSRPASSPVPSGDGAPTSILNPFSVYEKGEAMLRRRLAALSAWHLVNIAREYELTNLGVDTLNQMPANELIDVIVRGVREGVERPA
jgi:hypothetical protein